MCYAEVAKRYSRSFSYSLLILRIDPDDVESCRLSANYSADGVGFGALAVVLAQLRLVASRAYANATILELH